MGLLEASPLGQRWFIRSVGGHRALPATTPEHVRTDSTSPLESRTLMESVRDVGAGRSHRACRSGAANSPSGEGTRSTSRLRAALASSASMAPLVSAGAQTLRPLLRGDYGDEERP